MLLVALSDSIIITTKMPKLAFFYISTCTCSCKNTGPLESSAIVSEMYLYMYMYIHLSGSAFCWVDIGLRKQALGWVPPRFRIGYER